MQLEADCSDHVLIYLEWKYELYTTGNGLFWSCCDFDQEQIKSIKFIEAQLMLSGPTGLSKWKCEEIIKLITGRLMLYLVYCDIV
jgi:hypothetical protein